MIGYSIAQLRKKLSSITQAELARALEVSPVTINRWENNDPRYKPSDKETRLLEALDELAASINTESRRGELRDLLRVSTVAGVIGKAAIERMLKPATITLLAATPGLGWLGLVADIGVGAALPFFSKARVRENTVNTPEADQAQPAVPTLEKPVPASRGARKKAASSPPPPQPALYSLSIETL